MNVRDPNNSLPALQELSLTRHAPREKVRMLDMSVLINSKFTDSEIADLFDDFLNNNGIIPLGSCVSQCKQRELTDTEWEDVQRLYG